LRVRLCRSCFQIDASGTAFARLASPDDCDLLALSCLPFGVAADVLPCATTTPRPLSSNSSRTSLVSLSELFAFSACSRCSTGLLVLADQAHFVRQGHLDTAACVRRIRTCASFCSAVRPAFTISRCFAVSSGDSRPHQQSTGSGFLAEFDRVLAKELDQPSPSSAGHVSYNQVASVRSKRIHSADHRLVVSRLTAPGIRAARSTTVAHLTPVRPAWRSVLFWI
jgi:hypothetical protein